MTVTAIIQARMGSSRLPGKVLKEINGKPLLLHQINRLKKCRKIDNLVVATTLENQDNQLVEFCNKYNINVFRGSEENVLERYYGAWNQFGGETIVRLTSDCPIIDPDIVDETINYFLINDFDYVSNTLERTFPRGLDTEVFTAKALKNSYKFAILDRDKEHVTPYIYTNSDKFRLGCYKGKENYSKYRWTVDTKEDFELINLLLNVYKGKETDLKLKDAIKLMEANPQWFEINREIEQKKI